MDWKENYQFLERDFLFQDFKQALSFIVSVGLYAEQQNHHPTITNTYNKVKITLTTHSAGNKVTAKDQTMKGLISELYLKFNV